MIDGLIAATYTPLKSDATLNIDVIEQYAAFLIRNKVNGIFMNGSTGDFVSLSVEERMEITKAWSAFKSKGLYIIDHVGHTNIDIAKNLAKHAADKVDAIAAIAPYYFTLNSEEKLVEYCKIIAEQAQIPFYYYHIPALSKTNLSMTKFIALAVQEIDTFAGIKFTDNNLIDFAKCKKLLNGHANILFGFDELFINSLPLGAKGWVGSTYNHLAPLYHKLQKCFEQGDMTEASRLQSLAISFVDTVHNNGGFNGIAKSFMKQLGIDCGPSRFPHKSASLETLDLLSASFLNSGLSAYFSK